MLKLNGVLNARVARFFKHDRAGVGLGLDNLPNTMNEIDVRIG